MGSTQDQTVAEVVRDKFDKLTRAECQLANKLLENYPVTGLQSITALADAAGVSTPTVVRLSKKLGFKGFPQLQTALRQEAEATLSNPINKHDRWADAAPDTHITNLFADAVMNNVRQTLRHTDPDEFDAVVELFSNQSHGIHVVGGRITRSLAEHFFTHMQVIRNGITLMSSNSNTWPHFILNMKPDDILVIFDIRRYERDVLRLAKLAKSKGVKIVLFTDQWGSPISKQAEYSFYSRIEVPSAWDSLLVPLLIVEALIAAVQNASWKESEGRMKALEKLFDQTHMFRKFK